MKPPINWYFLIRGALLIDRCRPWIGIQPETKVSHNPLASGTLHFIDFKAATLLNGYSCTVAQFVGRTKRLNQFDGISWHLHAFASVKQEIGMSSEQSPLPSVRFPCTEWHLLTRPWCQVGAISVLPLSHARHVAFCFHTHRHSLHWSRR